MKTLVASFTFTKSINYPQHHPQNGITYKIEKRGAHTVLGRLLCSPYVCHLSWPRVLAAQEHYLHKQQFISATSLFWDQLQNLLQSIKTRVFYVFKTVSPAPNLSCTVSLFVQYYYRTLIFENKYTAPWISISLLQLLPLSIVFYWGLQVTNAMCVLNFEPLE